MAKPFGAKDKKPRKTDGYKKRFCLKGHDTSVCGRDKNTNGCIDCKNQLAREYYNKNRKRIGIRMLDKQWKQDGLLNLDGTTFRRVDYTRIFEDQRGLCKICGLHQSTFVIALAVDHNHKTGKVRGLLCRLCNLLVGIIEKELDSKKIIEYLNEN